MPAFENQQVPARSDAPVRAAKVDRSTPRPVHAGDPLLAGQQALGNQAAQRLLLAGGLQAKLRVGAPDDSYEQEADRVAETVMRMPEPEVRRQGTEEGEEEEEGIRAEPLAEGITPLVQRQAETPPEEEDEEEPPQAAPAPGEVQRQEAEPAQEEEEEEPQGVQLKSKGAGITHVRDAALVQRLRSPDGGVPLPGGVRSFFERRFEYDFSEVRVHDASRDRADAESLGARAFTYGKNIWLGHGESVGDSRLLAHELTHVVQQDGGVRRRALAVSSVAPRVQRSWWDRVTETVGGVISSVGELVGDAKAAVLGKLAQWARRIPGFDLLTVILGRDPISDQPVERNATNLIKGALGLLGPPGIAMFENLEKSGAIDRAFEWFETEISKLNLTWETVKGLFRTAWDSLSLSDLTNLSGAVGKLSQVFGPTLSRLANFASAAGRKVLEFVFEGALSLAGGFGTRVLGIMRRAGAVFSTIINDPVRFVGNLVSAVRGGFERFSDNILDHLRTALMQWLFGALSGAGLTLPDRFDLRGIVSIVLQILGLTYNRLRAKLVGLIGEKNVARIEGAFDFLRTIVTGGLAAAWEKIVEFAENLQEMVIGSIREWVARSIVGAAVKKLVTMFNPAGAVIQAIMAVYNTVVFFIERAQQIAALAEAVFDSISNIAAGNIGAAISYVERTMARALPVVIGFLARLIGLGNVSDHVRDIIKKIQAPVDRAIDRVASFVVQRAKNLLAVGTGDLTPQQRLERALSAAQSAVNRFAGRRVGALVLNPLLGAIRLRYQLRLLDVVPRGENWFVRGAASPEVEKPTEAKTEAGAPGAGDLVELKKLVSPAFSDVSYGADALGRAKAPEGYVRGVKAGEERERMPRDLLKKGYYPQDDKGHLIADRFYGPARPENLVPMHEDLNNGRYKAYENRLAREYEKHHKAGKAVLLFMHIRPEYPSDDKEDFNSYRPASIVARSTIYTPKVVTGEGAKLVAEPEQLDDRFTNPPGEIKEFNINASDLEELEAHLRALRVERKLREAILTERGISKFGGFNDVTRRLTLRYYERILPPGTRYNMGSPAGVYYMEKMKALLPPESKIRF